jgi:hypothetical protein
LGIFQALLCARLQKRLIVLWFVFQEASEPKVLRAGIKARATGTSGAARVRAVTALNHQYFRVVSLSVVLTRIRRFRAAGAATSQIDPGLF